MLSVWDNGWPAKSHSNFCKEKQGINKIFQYQKETCRRKTTLIINRKFKVQAVSTATDIKVRLLITKSDCNLNNTIFSKYIPRSKRDSTHP